MHFFNPVPVLRLVELVAVAAHVARDDEPSGPSAFATDVLGKQVIRSPGPRRFVVNALLDPVPAVGDPHDGVGLRHGRGHRHRHGRGLRPPDGPAAPDRPDRPRHHDGGGRVDCTRSSRSRCTRRRRCCRAWSRPACSAARPAAASTTTPAPDRASHGGSRVFRAVGCFEHPRPAPNTRRPEIPDTRRGIVGA